METNTSIFEDLEEEQDRETPLIRSIKVVDLFGQYTYNIRVRSNDTPRIILLYGDNGSGKTTILNIVWHLLSPSTIRGHRTALARIPFREFAVHLSNGDVITLKKINDLTGNYEIMVANGKSVICAESYQTDEALTVRPSLKRSAAIQEYLSHEVDASELSIAELEDVVARDVRQDSYIALFEANQYLAIFPCGQPQNLQ